MRRTPDDLTITPRNMQFGRGDTHDRWWHGGDPAKTAFYNALSLTFPLGEAFFIESVRHYRNEVPETLKGQIAAFVRQEGVHSREHVEFNRHVTETGYDVSAIEGRFADRLKQRRAEARPLVSLAITAALEHFTAILAHVWLKDPRHFAGAPDEIARLWRWHAIEEVEHKAVAYDTLLHATRDMSAFARWRFRCRVMVLITVLFIFRRIADMKTLLVQDGSDRAATWVKFAFEMIGSPGLFRQIFLPWAAFFLPGFHPWNHDDRALIAKAQFDLGMAPA